MEKSTPLKVEDDEPEERDCEICLEPLALRMTADLQRNRFGYFLAATSSDMSVSKTGLQSSCPWADGGTGSPGKTSRPLSECQLDNSCWQCNQFAFKGVIRKGGALITTYRERPCWLLHLLPIILSFIYKPFIYHPLAQFSPHPIFPLPLYLKPHPSNLQQTCPQTLKPYIPPALRLIFLSTLPPPHPSGDLPVYVGFPLP